MLPMTSVVVDVSSARSWLPIVAKWSIRLMQITERKVMNRQEDMSWKVVGLNPVLSKICFPRKISVEVSIYVHVADLPKIWMKTFFNANVSQTIISCRQVFFGGYPSFAGRWVFEKKKNSDLLRNCVTGMKSSWTDERDFLVPVSCLLPNITYLQYETHLTWVAATSAAGRLEGSRAALAAAPPTFSPSQVSRVRSRTCLTSLATCCSILVTFVVATQVVIAQVRSVF